MENFSQFTPSSPLIDIMAICAQLFYFTEKSINTITIEELVSRFPMNDSKVNPKENLKRTLQDIQNYGGTISTTDNFATMKIEEDKLKDLTKVIGDMITGNSNR